MTPIDPWVLWAISGHGTVVEAPSPEECGQALAAIEAIQATNEARQPGMVAEVHQDRPIDPEACMKATKALCG